ncbi:MAG: hypothetical protein HYZ55_01130, partial [Nitrosarchaeum sp.]|nr:hypothetical protein [Nitrosarchaeum sp.]
YFVLLLVIGFSLLSIPQVFAIGQPPPERAPVSSHGVYDLDGKRVEFVKVGQQVNIQADLANAQDIEQSIAYIVLIYDSNRNIVHRGSIEGVLAPNMGFTPAVSWIPEKTGYYKAEIFVWPSMDNPAALSPVLESEFYVVRNLVGIHLECKEGFLYIVKVNEEIPKNYCVKPTTKVELILRGWAVDDRENWSGRSADTSHLYPADKAEYRKLLESYYLKELDNEKEQFVKISLGEFKNVHSVGSPINDFIIKLEGYFPTYNSPDIKLEDEAGNIVWTNYDDIGHVYTSRVSSVEFCKEYRFYDIGDPLIINKTGTYKFIFSFEGFSLEKEIKIRENVSDISIDSP